MEKASFSGLITAIVTPFMADKSIDFEAYKKILDYQLENKVDGLVIAGTTGEGATLTNKEKVILFTETVEYVNGRCAVIAGTGTNNTQLTIDLTIIAKEHGCDACLLVAPYYNKPNQEGLYGHFRAIAEAVNIPQIIYNVPGRTGVNINAETQLRLAEDCQNIVATKEASGDLVQIMEIIKNAPDNFKILSGDDALAVPTIAMGGDGIISVISNYAPKQFGECIHFALDGNLSEANKIHYDLLELMQLNFIESNPLPVKTAFSLMGICQEEFRLPLVGMKAENKEKMKIALKKKGFII